MDAGTGEMNSLVRLAEVYYVARQLQKSEYIVAERRAARLTLGEGAPPAPWV